MERLMISAERHHDFCAGHRVVGQGGKCEHLHGHNYRVHFTIEAHDLDSVGRVLDFGDMKTILASWVEREWDHRFLVWKGDPLRDALLAADPSCVTVDFNPTAENMAVFLLEQSNRMLPTCVRCTSIRLEETRKCSATARIVVPPMK